MSKQEESNEVIPKAEETIEEVKKPYTKKTFTVDKVIAKDLRNSIDNIEESNPLEDHYQNIKGILKGLNNNKVLKYIDFSKFFDEYIENNTIKTDNVMIKQFLESNFVLLEDNILKAKTISELSLESMSALVNGLCINVIVKMNEDYNSFEEYIDTLEETAISKTSLPKVKSYYNKISKLL